MIPQKGNVSSVSYLNADDQRRIIILAAIGVLADEYKKLPKMKPVKRKLGLISKHANDIKETLLENVDEDCVEGIKRRCAYEKIELVNKARKIPGMYFVGEEDMVSLIGYGAETNCLGCEKSGKEIKRCKLHKTFLRCGIITDKMEKDDGKCPFEW